MDERTISHNVNFELHKVLSKNNKNGVRKITKQFETQLNNRPFDATAQNLQVANFFLTLNPDRFLNEVDKHGIAILDMVKNPDPTKPLSQQTARFYLIYNWFYFSKLTERNLPFVETEHFNFRGVLRSLTALPTFPILKMFLSKMNYLCDSNNKVRLFEHIEEIHRLIEYGKEFKSAKGRALGPPKNYNSCIYGGRFANLADMEQNHFHELEVQIAGLLLLAMSHWFARNNIEMDKTLTEVREKLLSLREDTTPLDKHDDKKPIYEERLACKLFSHIEAIVQYLQLIRKLRIEGPTVLIDTSLQVFYKENRLEEKYFLPVMNLLALLNFKDKSPSVAHLLLSRLVSSGIGRLTLNTEKLDRFEGLSRLNNPLMRQPIAFNLFISMFSIGEYAKAVDLADSLTSTFVSNYKFWYILGLCHFKLWEKERDKRQRREWEETGKIVREASRLLEKRRMKLVLPIDPTWEAPAKKITVPGPREVETDDAIKTMGLATSCLENSLNLLHDFYSKEHLSVIFQPSSSRYKDYFNQIKILLGVEVQKYLGSVLEHLAFLYISANKPMQALKAISLSLSSVKLKASERAKLAVYHLKAAMMLKKTVLVKTSLGDLDNSTQNNDKNDFLIAKNGGNGGLVLPALFVLKYSKLIAVSKDREQARQALQRLLEEWGRFGQTDKNTSERLLRRALFFYYSKVEFSREMLRQVSNPSYEVSNFVSAKNGKILTSI